MSAISATHSIGAATQTVGRTLDRISSGLRVVSARDDAAALGVATNLNTTARAIRVAIRNANDGVSIIQHTESALQTATDIMQRMRELGVQSASETLQNKERAYIETEFSELKDEIERVALDYNFNGMNLTDGLTTTLSVQVGIYDNAASRVDIQLANVRKLHSDISSTSIATVTSARQALADLDSTLDNANSMRSELGATQNRLESTIKNSGVYTESMLGAASQIQDANMAVETAELARSQIMKTAASSVLTQSKNITNVVVDLIA